MRKGKNYHLVLRQEIEDISESVFYITAFSFYRLTVNGEFVFFGPARTARGYARVDEIPLGQYNREGKNEIMIEVNGYYCQSISTVKQPSFVIAELCRGEEVLLCTGRDFEGYRSSRMVQKVQRYSAQRHFGEVWDYRGSELGERVELVAQDLDIKYLPRVAPFPSVERGMTEEYSSVGIFSYDESIDVPRRYSFDITEDWGRYEDDEIEYAPYPWFAKQVTEIKRGGGRLPITLSEGEYALIDMKRVECGFICMETLAHEDSDVVVGFSELCFDEKFAFTAMNARNVVEYLLKGGENAKTMTFEPYTYRYAMVMVKKGSISLSSFGVRRFEYNRSKIIRDITTKDAQLREIYEAAVNTFAHNALDLYMDCPSRERAGWLCDTFFTGRAEYFLTGKSLVEDAFLENYRLYQYCGEYPEGALPMCYPSDVERNHHFIPQWDMWYIIEVKEYLTERNTSIDRELFRKSVYGVLSFLSKYENEEGLLQNLPGWNFVEWSTANEWVQDVNYPTNFLYAEALRCVGELYGESELIEKGNRVAEVTRRKAFDGEVFIDNAILDGEGKLKNTKNSSEAGQYYAILFGNVDIDAPEFSKLKSYVIDGFKTFNTEGRGFVPVNAFIGFYLRICVLMKLGYRDILEKDIKFFFGGMSELTGTLWEYRLDRKDENDESFKSRIQRGSLDHGFASFAAVAIDFIENQ